MEIQNVPDQMLVSKQKIKDILKVYKFLTMSVYFNVFMKNFIARVKKCFFCFSTYNVVLTSAGSLKV